MRPSRPECSQSGAAAAAPGSARRTAGSSRSTGVTSCLPPFLPSALLWMLRLARLVRPEHADGLRSPASTRLLSEWFLKCHAAAFVKRRGQRAPDPGASLQQLRGKFSSGRGRRCLSPPCPQAASSRRLAPDRDAFHSGCLKASSPASSTAPGSSSGDRGGATAPGATGASAPLRSRADTVGPQSSAFLGSAVTQKLMVTE